MMALLYQDEPWMDDAACRGSVAETGSYDDFFQRKDGSTTASVARSKYELCADCPVAFECFDYAARIEAVGGVWGGMDPDPRRRMLNRYGTAAKARKAHAAHLKELRRVRDVKVARIEREKRLA